jgi:ABC-type uncharacterized transport system substrate-binding protein
MAVLEKQNKSTRETLTLKTFLGEKVRCQQITIRKTPRKKRKQKDAQIRDQNQNSLESWKIGIWYTKQMTIL